jgi:hypothetical protein
VLVVLVGWVVVAMELRSRRRLRMLWLRAGLGRMRLSLGIRRFEGGWSYVWKKRCDDLMNGDRRLPFSEISVRIILAL